MAPWAVGFSGMNRRHVCESTQHVYAMRYGLQVGRKHAKRGSAQMIQLSPCWDGSVYELIREAMSVDMLAVNTEASVPIVVTCRRPEPARFSLVDFPPEVQLRLAFEENTTLRRTVAFPTGEVLRAPASAPRSQLAIFDRTGRFGAHREPILSGVNGAGVTSSAPQHYTTLCSLKLRSAKNAIQLAPRGHVYYRYSSKGEL